MNQLQKSVLTATVLCAMVLPTIASAQTTLAAKIADLTAKIQALQIEVAALQAQQRGLVVEQKASAQTLARALKEGMTGDDVKMLQALLASDSTVYPEGNISGYYGKMTALAVKRFQKKHNLEQVGNVGPKTLKKLAEQLEKDPIEIREVEDDDGDESDNEKDEHGKRKNVEHVVCHKVPPGHLVAPGWLRKHDGVKPVVPECQALPKGIRDILEDNKKGTTTWDKISPVISGVTTSSIATTSAMISWTTNEPATGKVYVGTTNPVVATSSTVVTAGILATSQSVTLSRLIASTTYYYIVDAKDASNNVGVSAQQSFATTN